MEKTFLLFLSVHWGDLIEQVKKICHIHFNIRRIRKYLSQETTGTLVHAFLTVRIDYCYGLFYGLPNIQLAKIQRVLGVLLLGWYVMRLSFAIILH